MKRTVLALGPLPPPYHGVATFLRDVLAQKDPAGIEFLHLDTSDHRDSNNLGRWDVTNLLLGFSHLTEAAARQMRYPVDVVYLPLSQSIPACIRDALFILQARLLGARVVIHLHGGYFRTLYEQKGGVFFRALMRLALSQTSAVIVLGEKFRPIFDGLVDEQRVFVVENGVSDTGAFALCAANPEPPESVILFMSTLTRTKGVLVLLDAFARVARQLPLARLRIAGAWAEESLRVEALALIQRENLADKVEFVGNVAGREKAAFLASGQIFCLPTYYPFEGQPLVILEALAAGLPVVSTAQGVIPATVQDGQNGRVLPVESPPDVLAAALLELLTDSEKCHAYAQSARRHYLEKYTLSACHRRLNAVLLD